LRDGSGATADGKVASTEIASRLRVIVNRALRRLPPIDLDGVRSRRGVVAGSVNSRQLERVMP
jgi:hypothetical protein